MSGKSNNAVLIGRHYLFVWELVTLNCKDCIRQKTCWQKEKPPPNCRRFDNFSTTWKHKVTILGKVFKETDREIRLNKPVKGPL